MRTVWTKTLIGAFTAAALAATAFASPAEARGGDIFPRGGGGHSNAFHGGGMHGGGAFAGGGFRGGAYAGRGGGHWGNNGGGYNGGYYGGGWGGDGWVGPAVGLGVLGLATGALLSAPYASAEEGCLVRQPVWSHGRIVSHRWVNAC